MHSCAAVVKFFHAHGAVFLHHKGEAVRLLPAAERLAGFSSRAQLSPAAAKPILAKMADADAAAEVLLQDATRQEGAYGEAGCEPMERTEISSGVSTRIFDAR